MSNTAIDLENLVREAVIAAADPPGGPAAATTTMRERFFELMVMALGNLYTRTPIAATLFDRATMLRVTEGMDDNDAGKLVGRTEDWLRLEGMVRQQDGSKAYFMTRTSLAVLSTLTSQGPVGEVMDKILRRYRENMPSENLRRSTRLLASYFLTRVARS